MNKNAFLADVQEHDYLLVLRGMAVIGVLLGHAFGIGANSLGVYISESPSGVFRLIDHPLDLWRYMLFVLTPLLGANFVLLFFVQSGYLMGKVFQEGRYQFAVKGIIKFYRARFFRIAPLLYFNLIVCLMFFKFGPVSLEELLGDFFFVTNFTGRSINLVTWSLSHEMQYYLLCPLVFVLFRVASWRTFVACCAAVAAIYFVTRDGFLSHFAYLYSFVAGYAANLLTRLWPGARTTERFKIIALCLGMALINCGYNWLFLTGHASLSETLVVLVSVFLVVCMELPSSYEISGSRPIVSKIISFGVTTGALTYGIYLWHYVLIRRFSTPFSILTDRLFAHLPGALSGLSIPLFHLVQISFVFIATYFISLYTFRHIEVKFRPGLYKFSGPSPQQREERASQPG
jgi:peptidoglycan/LPS O-acetylase OafA/YrhL